MIEQLNKKYSFILASKSPRRQKLLKDLGIRYTLRKSKLENEESEIVSEPNLACELAKQKAENTEIINDNEIIITADTIVICDGIEMGKPENFSQANQMLKQISGKKHSVITGVCLKDSTHYETFYSETDVFFAEIDDSEIRNYIERYRPYDKAGAYGIQEWIGYIGIEKIVGSYYNVVGLPVQLLYQKLKERL